MQFLLGVVNIFIQVILSRTILSTELYEGGFLVCESLDRRKLLPGNKRTLWLSFYHDKIEDMEVHAVKRLVKVEQERQSFIKSDKEEDVELEPTHLSN